MNNPYLRAALAALYIIAIAYGVNFMSTFTKAAPETMLIPMTMLSLLVLSAAVMGYLFLSVPFQLYLDNKRKEAFAFFGKTVGTFALFAAAFVAALLYSAI